MRPRPAFSVIVARSFVYYVITLSVFYLFVNAFVYYVIILSVSYQCVNALLFCFDLIMSLATEENPRRGRNIWLHVFTKQYFYLSIFHLDPF